MEFAPVLIPTLCRYAHFKRCIESLNNCVGANETEVYVALDFPANSSHEDGWRLIREYLLKFKHNFKALHIIERDHNYGLGIGGNINTLIKDIILKHDVYIFSEDDNEFSPNFLLYMNSNLERYKDNEDVFFICGYNYPVNFDLYKYNSYPSYQFSAWGYGTWSKKLPIIRNYYSIDAYKEYFKSWKQLWKIFRNEPRMINVALQLIHENRIAGDSSYVLFQLAHDKISIFPVLSKVRNWGMDGSGFSKTPKPELAHQIIDDEMDFQNENIPLLMRNDMRKVINNYFYRNWYNKIGILLRMVIYKYTKWDFVIYYRERKMQIMNHFKDR